MKRSMNVCERCGGAVAWDREDANDAPVLKCLICARKPGPPRPHEEPQKHTKAMDFVPGITEKALNRARVLEWE